MCIPTLWEPTRSESEYTCFHKMVQYLTVLCYSCVFPLCGSQLARKANIRVFTRRSKFLTVLCYSCVFPLRGSQLALRANIRVFTRRSKFLKVLCYSCVFPLRGSQLALRANTHAWHKTEAISYSLVLFMCIPTPWEPTRSESEYTCFHKPGFRILVSEPREKRRFEIFFS